MIVVGDCLQVLAAMQPQSVHCVITSPPYWGLRSYQGDPGMIGLEPTLEEHIERLVEVFRQVRRVLRSDGTLWLNYGDAYQNKQLLMMPARVALALQSDGWQLSSEIVWHKPNPMPESVTKRPTSSHEKLFLFAKSGKPTYWLHEDGRGSRTKPEPDYRWITDEETGESKRRNKWRGRDYFYDAEAVRTPSNGYTKMPDGWDTGPGGHGTVHRDGREKGRKADKQRGHDCPHQGFDNDWNGRAKAEQQTSGANLRNVWRIPVHAYKGAHFATFPPALVEPCIKAGTSAKGVCGACGAPWVRQVERVAGHSKDCPATEAAHYERGGTSPPVGTVGRSGGSRVEGTTTTLGWHPSCTCHPDELTEAISEGSDHPNSYNMARYLAEKEGWIKPAVVLDPFGGAGTVALVAQRLGRKALCIEISPEYARMAQQRFERDLPVTRRPNREQPGDFKLELM